MIDLSKILDKNEIERLGPLRLAYLAHVLDDNISNETLKEYVQTFRLKKPEDVKTLMLVDAFIAELNKRDANRMNGMLDLVRQGKSLEEIVDYGAIALSRAISHKEYRKLVKAGKQAIIEDARRIHLETVQARLKPFKAYTSLQFFRRTFVSLALIIGLFGYLGVVRNKEHNDLLQYAKQHIAEFETTSRSDDIKKVLEEAALADKFSDAEIREKSLANKQLFNSMDLWLTNYNAQKGEKDEDITVKKLAAYDEFIEKTEGARKIVFKYKKGQLMDDAALTTVEINGRDLIALALKEGASHVGLFSDKELFDAANRIFRVEYKKTQNQEQAVAAAVVFLHLFSLENKETYLGDIALTILAGINSSDRNFYLEDNGFVSIRSRLSELKLNDLNGVIYAWSADSAKARRYYESLISKTKQANIYCGADFALLSLEPVDIKQSDLSQKYARIKKYLSIAGTTSDKILRDTALIEVAKIYIKMKLYKPGNDYLKYVASNQTNDALVSAAENEMVNESRAVFFDHIFNR